MENPKLPPILVNKAGSVYYVYTYKNVWDRELKRSKRGESKKIGKILGGQKDGVICFDESFLQERPEFRSFQVERKGKEYVFTPLNESGTTLTQLQEVKQLHAGATWALDQLVAQSPVGEALKWAFPQRRDYLKILSICYFIILNQDNNISKYETFAEVTRLPWGAPLAPSSISRVFRKIRNQQIETYFSFFRDELLEQQEKYGDKNEITLALDSTSGSNYVINNLLNLERHRYEDEDNLPLINLLALTDYESGIAFFYRAYDGKVPAAKTVSQVISENAGLSLKNVVFVSDKGYSDAKNINDCLRNKLGFLFNVQCAMPDSFAQELIDGEKENLRDLNRMDWLTKVFQITKEINWTFESDPVEGQVTSKKTKESTILYWHIYFNRQFAENARQGLIERIDRVREKIYNGEELDENELTLLEDVFEKHEEGDMISYTISNEKVDQKLRYKGYQMLVSDKISDARKAWCVYQERRILEDTFKTLKTRLSCVRNRVSDNESLIGKTFVQFLATSIEMIVRARLRKYLEEGKASDSLPADYDPARGILDSLNNVMQTKFCEGYYFGESAEQKRGLFEALGVSVPGPETEKEQDYEDEEETEF
ncbi:transposase [Parasutterella sp.]|uniref:IS1634 family transposase n=1 Tax=Parasutterella sp. TaxID=2049037 RepID=UPI003AB30FAC